MVYIYDNVLVCIDGHAYLLVPILYVNINEAYDPIYCTAPIQNKFILTCDFQVEQLFYDLLDVENRIPLNDLDG